MALGVRRESGVSGVLGRGVLGVGRVSGGVGVVAYWDGIVMGALWGVRRVWDGSLLGLAWGGKL